MESWPPALQPLSPEVPVPPALVGAAVRILSESLAIDELVDTAGHVLLELPGVETVACALTRFWPVRDTGDHDGWARLGDRAWLRQWSAPGTAIHLGPKSGPAPAEVALSVPWLSQQGRLHGLVSLGDVEDLAEVAPTDHRQLRARGVVAMASQHLATDGEVFGSLSVCRSLPGPWDPGHLNGLQLVTHALAARLCVLQARESLAESLSRGDSARHSQHQFFSALRHEIRTPIAAVIGTAEVLRQDLSEQTGLPVDVRDGLLSDTDAVVAAGEQISAVVEDLLTIAQKPASQEAASPVDVAAAAYDVGHWIHAPAVAKGVSLTLGEELAQCPPVSSTPFALRQILTNLVGNAVAYNAPRGAVHVSASVSTDAGGPQRVRVTVRDDGPGLTPEQQAVVFDPFVRFADHTPGTGLGLALSRTLAERYDALLGVESRPGEGASFWLDLPVWAR